jgi:uncharacterized membrane protein YeaQ/YmgE (transglycosylase-associated protein family)
MAIGAGLGLVAMIFIILAIGAVAGWLAGKIMEGHGFGFWANAGLGILGAFIGPLVFGLLGVYNLRADRRHPQGDGRRGHCAGHRPLVSNAACRVSQTAAHPAVSK